MADTPAASGAKSDEPTLTGTRKRQQISSANRAMLIWVAATAAIVTIAAVLAVNFVQRISYNAKVISAKSQTDNTLKSNITNFATLKANINKLQTDQNLLGLKADSDDTALQVVLDALPTQDDRTALGSSLQNKVLNGSGAKIDQLSVTDSSSAAATSTTATSSDGSDQSAANLTPTAQPITFSFSITGSYDTIANSLVDIENTIRPIVINSLDISGTQNQLEAKVSATTYYSPMAQYSLGSKEVKP
ncbi:MAG: hypothetical protein LBM73_01075 [Candidatus Nomurabacteria bacterium]|jgi:Tfp pilus assembly protein PilO|nr:hypothetical protein [Candidatus Nomurabacteria bacterium]